MVDMPEPKCRAGVGDPAIARLTRNCDSALHTTAVLEIKQYCLVIGASEGGVDMSRCLLSFWYLPGDFSCCEQPRRPPMNCSSTSTIQSPFRLADSTLTSKNTASR